MISMWLKHFSLFMFFVCDDARKNMCDRHRPYNYVETSPHHIKCLACDADYIGKTKRILIHKIKEHKKIESSACAAHMVTNPGHHMDFENINIIDQASNDMKLKIKELLHIIQKKPKLNKQLSSQSSYEIQTLLIQAYPQFQPSQNK